jgi:glutamate dehydrogenase
VATKPHDTKAALLEGVVARVRDTVDKAEADDAERFVRSYYANVAPDDLIGRSEADLAGAALAHWGLARVRRPGELKVHVYTPSLEEHGWESPHTVVQAVIDDMPFLVDSVSMEVSRHGRAIHLVIRPIMRMRRDGDGRLLEVNTDEGNNESLIHLELDRLPDAAAIEELGADVHRVLGDVRAAVEDWKEMRQRTKDILGELASSPPPVDSDELAEARAFLEWLEDDHFTFLGYREYDMLSEDGDDVLRAVPGSGLGILREKEGTSASFAVLPPDVRRRAREKHLLNLTKANSRATVHRPVYLDYVGVKRFDDSGEVAGERRFLGLYTHTAYRVTPWEIPVVRQKADRVLERSGLLPGSHDHKALV